MAKTPKTNLQAISALERRVDRLEERGDPRAKVLRGKLQAALLVRHKKGRSDTALSHAIHCLRLAEIATSSHAPHNPESVAVYVAYAAELLEPLMTALRQVAAEAEAGRSAA